MRKANRVGAKHIIVLGEDELKKNNIVIKDMTSKEETPVALVSHELQKIIRRNKKISPTLKKGD
jgi:histidyl-tRNA synthetase